MRHLTADTTDLARYPVWDRTTRWFHWLNLSCVLVLASFGLVILNAKTLGVSGEAKVLLKTLHVYVGYVFALNLGWRLIWGFVGNSHARWKSMLPIGQGYLTDLRTYVRGIVTGEQTDRHLGHNPLGRLMVSLLMMLLVTQAVTGLVLAGTDLYKPPFGSAIAQWVTGGDPEKLAELTPGSTDFVDQAAYEEMRNYRKPIVTTHLYVFYLLVIAVVLHVVGVVITELREKSGLISAMVTGEKVLPARFQDRPVKAPKTDATK